MVYPTYRCDQAFLMTFAISNSPVSILVHDGLTYTVLRLVIVIGTTGLRGTEAWSRAQGGYVTVAIGDEVIHKTTTVGNGKDPEWNDTFQLWALFDGTVVTNIL
jgi:hypothetical protein